jgi:general stress protein 26
MNLNKRIFKVSAFLSLLLAGSIAPNAGSQENRKQLSQAELVAAARAIMTAARFCALITLDSSGRPQARTLDPFPPDEQMVVWLATNPRTRKVGEIRRNPRVTLYYFDREEQAYVTIYGIARLVNDPKEKAKHWKDEWKDFYPDRARDFLLIVVKPEKLEIVNVKRGIVGDPNTWKPRSVSFPKQNE